MDNLTEVRAERDYYKRKYERLKEIAECNDPGAVGAVVNPFSSWPVPESVSTKQNTPPSWLAV